MELSFIFSPLVPSQPDWTIAGHGVQQTPWGATMLCALTSDNIFIEVLSDERLGTKLRVTENRCVVFNSLTSVYLTLLPQHWAFYAKVNSTPTIILYIYIYDEAQKAETVLSAVSYVYIYIYIYIYIYCGRNNPTIYTSLYSYVWSTFLRKSKFYTLYIDIWTTTNFQYCVKLDSHSILDTN